MKKSKMSTGAKVALIFGLVLILAGAGWWGYTSWQESNSSGTQVDEIPQTQPTDPVSTVDKIYREFYMPDDKNATLEDEYLDIVLVEAGRLSDNTALQTALAEAGVKNDGYYFLAELTFDSADKFKGTNPFGYLNGHVDDKTEVAAVSFYVMNSDLTGATSLLPGTITPGCHYVLVGYADYDVVDDAQIHLYNSDYDVSIIHMSADSETIAPYGYTKADNTVSTEPDTTEGTEGTTDVTENTDVPEDTTAPAETEEIPDSPDDVGGGGVNENPADNTEATEGGE